MASTARFSLADFRFAIPMGISSAGTTCSSTSTSANAPRRPSQRASVISSSPSTPFRRWPGRRSLDGSAEFFSQHYLDFIGLSAEQATAWGWTAAVHPEDVSGLAATWKRIIASEAPGEAEARLRGSDGDYRWFLFRCPDPLRDERGTIVNWYGVNTDIEDRKRAGGHAQAGLR